MQDVVGMVFDDIIINRTVLLAPFRAGLYIHVRHNGLPLLFHLLKYIHAAKSPAVADVSSFGQVLLSLRLPACEAGRVANCFHRRAFQPMICRCFSSNSSVAMKNFSNSCLMAFERLRTSFNPFSSWESRGTAKSLSLRTVLPLFF
jgi:hypothetical protein